MKFLKKTLPKLAFVLISLSVLITLIVLIGWASDNEALKTAGLGDRAMNPTTALIILTLNLSFLLLWLRSNTRVIAIILSVFVVIFSLARIFVLLFDHDLPLDVFVFYDTLMSDGLIASSNRMPFNTALAGVLGGVALVLIIRKRITSAHWIAIALLLLSMFSVFGFLYHVPEFSTTLLYLPMAYHTAVAYLLLSVAILIAWPSAGVTKELTSSQQGSILAKYLVPLVLILPVLIGYLRMWAHWRGAISIELGVTLIIFTITVLFTGTAGTMIYFLNRADRGRKQQEMELAAANHALEAANEEMVALNEEITAANEELLVSNEQLTALNDKLDAVNKTIARQKDEQLNRVLDISSDVMWSIDLTDARESYMSRSGEKLFGYNIEELMFKPLFWYEFVFEDDRYWVDEEIKKLNSQGVCECVFRIRKTDGGFRWVRCRPRIVFGNDGQPIRETGILSDITDQRYAEERISEYQTNLDIIFTNTNEGILLVDKTGRIKLFNTTYGNFLTKVAGAPPVEGRFLWDTTIKERKEVARNLFSRALTGEVIQTTAQFKFEDQEIIHSLRYEPVHKNGEVSHVCIISTDITQQHKRELDLQRSEANLKAIFNNTLDNFTLIDLSFNILAFNKNNAADVKLFTGKDLKVGNNMLKIISPARRSAFLHALERAAVNGFFKYDTKVEMGTVSKWFDVTITAVRDQNATLLGYCITSHDNSEARLAQSEILRLNQSLTDFQQAIYKSSIVSRADKAGFITFVNDNFIQVSGYGFGELIGQNHRIVNSGFHSKSFWTTMWKTISSGKTWRADVKNRKKDGTYYWVDTFIMPFINSEGEVTEYLSIRNDITDRKRYEDGLREFNERYELLSRATNDAIWDWNIASAHVSWNHGLETIFHYPPDEVKLTIDFWRENIHPDDLDRVLQSIDKTFAKQVKNWSSNYRFRCSGGVYKHVYDRAYIIFDEDGPVRMIGGMQDISDRVRAIEEIEKLSFVASKTDNAVMITDPNENIEWVNEGLVQMTGHSFDEVIGRKPNFLQGSETDREVVAKMREKIKRKESFSGELINYSKDGRKYWLRLDITPVFQDNGKLKHFISIQSDITEQKQYEAQITSIAEEMASLIENANVPIFGIDKEGRINEWNKVWTELSGFSRQHVLGKNWIDDMVGLSHQAACHQMINSVLWGKAISNFELPIVTPHRNLVLLLSASPRKDLRQNITGAILVAQDISELIEYRQNLEKIVQDRTRDLNAALQKEKELVQMKSRFVSIASHEFRTPLATISLATGFLKKFNLKLKPDDLVLRLQNIEKQVEHMTHLLDDVLMIGKSEAGKIPVNFSRIDLNTFFTMVVSEVEQSTNRTHVISFEMDLSTVEIESDEKLLRNIVINLLTNGIKFSPDAGEIHLTVKTTLTELTIIVADFGIGIPEDDIGKLFEPFYRASNATSIAGTGLGLSIIRKAIDLLNGAIDVSSTIEKGTTIHVVLPIKPN